MKEYIRTHGNCRGIINKTIYIIQSAAVKERPVADAGDGVGNCDACQPAAAIERTDANRSDGVWNGGVHTTSNQCICCCLDNGVTIITRVVCRISTCHNDARQPAAVRERQDADARDGVGDGDACQSAAAKERLFTDGRDGVGNCDAGQCATAVERTVADGCDGVGDGDACQSAAAIVSATYCVPIFLIKTVEK